jgi:hypothetical protein
MLYPAGTERISVDQLTELVYELLDAYGDTERLARDFGADLGWAAHLDYLRDLQRVGREGSGAAGERSRARHAQGCIAWSMAACTTREAPTPLPCRRRVARTTHTAGMPRRVVVACARSSYA